MRPGEYTGRKCDCCGLLETLQKTKQVFTKSCNYCERRNVHLCLHCIGKGINVKLLRDKWVACVNCQRDMKLSEIGIE